MANSSDDGSNSVVNYATDHLNMIGDGIKETYYGYVERLNVMGDNNQASIYGDCGVNEVKGDGNKVGIDGDTRQLNCIGNRNQVFINKDCSECAIIGDGNKVSIRGDSGQFTIIGDRNEISISGALGRRTIIGNNNFLNGKAIRQTEILGVAGNNPATPQMETVSGGYNFYGVPDDRNPTVSHDSHPNEGRNLESETAESSPGRNPESEMAERKRLELEPVCSVCKVHQATVWWPNRSLCVFPIADTSVLSTLTTVLEVVTKGTLTNIAKFIL